jgi:chromosome segregation ATPase
MFMLLLPCCCQEELRDKERAVKELTAEADSASSQLHGLQTVLTAKTAQCNRLEAEARQLERQLKQAQSAAAAEQEGLRAGMELLSGRVAEMEGQLAAAQQREQEQQVQLVAVRAKVRRLGCCGVCRKVSLKIVYYTILADNRHHAAARNLENTCSNQHLQQC